ncbi:Ketohexokinase [Phytophthora nicotianae]|uniref:Ketohexokinase n=1 Tax=Phytophthora nicotianae TaxID=4792 RepID=A0A0W8CQY0_PHYNI|nr:Ketohexokinase [Phytophthora nicotianae]
MEVIAVGTAAIDVVHEVAAYPAEDTKARSLATYKCRGGNAASALLGGRCRWLSTSTDPEKDSDAAFIHADLAAFNVDCSLAVIEKEGSMPVSYILASRETGSRTIVHSRTIAELTCEAFAAQIERYLKEIREDVDAPVWFHFEGRNMETVRNMMLHIRENAPQAKISVEIEFPRYPWTLAKTLASLADYVFMSKDYLRDNIHILSAKDFFDGIQAQRWDEDWSEWTKLTVDTCLYVEYEAKAGISYSKDINQGCNNQIIFVTASSISPSHVVSSEVEQDLERVQHATLPDTDVFIVPLLPAILEDNDGDIIVPRRQANKRRKSTRSEPAPARMSGVPREHANRGTDTTFVLQARSRTTWDTAGTQLWRAAFLLAEYMYSTSGDVRPRLLDWDDKSLISIAKDASAAQFDWISTDQAELENLTIIIASDVFYDDTLTLKFLRALRRLMLKYNRAKAYVTTERRSVFSAAAMQVVSLGYDTFQENICLHDPSTCHTYVTDNQVRCRTCIAGSSNQAGNDEDMLRFVVQEVQTSEIPQRFKYDRLSTLMLWKIDAVVVPIR